MNKRAKKRRRIIAWGVAVGLFALFCDSRFRLVTTQYELGFDNLPENFGGFRIVQLSDIHGREYGEDNERLISAVAAQEPDLIVITGDLINRNLSGESKGQSEKARPLLEGLSAIAPCYFVSGNHEWASGELSELAEVLAESGVKYLRNEYELITINGQSIVITGVEDPNGPAGMPAPPELVSRIRSAYPDSFIVLLGHRNDFLKKYPELDVDIVFCGHAHGGVWRIPGVVGLVGTERDLFPKYSEGVHEGDVYRLVISRGLGDSIEVPRLLNNPEIVSVILRCE